jgi:hypothetical protein
MTSRNNSDDNLQAFLLAVANADDRKSGWKKDDFDRDFHTFFPLRDAIPVERQLSAYDEVRRRWKVPAVDFSVEQPDSEYGYHVAIFRQQLRVIWRFADSGDLEKAHKKCVQLYTDVHRYVRDTADDASNQPWRVKLVAAVELLGNFKNLKLCENRECDNPYFIRHGRQLYCSIPCSAQAKALRHRDRQKDKPKKQFKASDETRWKQSIKATERWRREKRKAKEERKPLNSSDSN